MKKLNILLTNPCSQDWDAMNTSKQGRFCDKCEKHIVDMTTKSDDELITFFKKKKDNVCGRFLDTQLNRTLIATPKPKNWQWLVPFAVGFTVFTPAIAQEVTITNHQPMPGQSKIPAKPAKINTETEVSNDSITVNGVVRGKNKKPIANVSIKQHGTNNTIAKTNANGRFSIKLANDQTNTEFEFVHPMQRSIIACLNKPENEITFSEDIQVRLGGAHAINNDNAPIFVINSGKKTYRIENDKSVLSSIKPEWIENIRVIKDASQTAHYGARAANGTIIIDIHKKFAKKVKFLEKISH